MMKRCQPRLRLGGRRAGRATTRQTRETTISNTRGTLAAYLGADRALGGAAGADRGRGWR
eukprot:7038628-Prymnesium_polylepis.1